MSRFVALTDMTYPRATVELFRLIGIRILVQHVGSSYICYLEFRHADPVRFGELVVSCKLDV